METSRCPCCTSKYLKELWQMLSCLKSSFIQVIQVFKVDWNYPFPTHCGNFLSDFRHKNPPVHTDENCIDIGSANLYWCNI